jgi:solute carrier family 35, member C2
MFSKDELDFHFPLFTTSIHMVVQFIFASLVLYFFPRFRPSNAVIEDKHADGQESEQSKKTTMSIQYYLTRVGPCATATALDIGLGNMSLKTITLTFFSEFFWYSQPNY